MPVLYHLTLQKPTAITKTVYGNFSGPRFHEIIVAKGQVLELLRSDKQGKLNVIISKDIFGIIRSISTFRLTGSNKDYIVIGSDSGRALMICAVEKQKFVYILNRDNKENLTISSPLEAHKSHSICHDVNYESLDKQINEELENEMMIEVNSDEERKINKEIFFILIQSEYGDLYKIEVDHEDGIVKEIVCKYFDTVPIANSISVLKSGSLFVAAEFGNHYFLNCMGLSIEELADNDYLVNRNIYGQ
ncbi:splicing factor 3B subunit 3,putative [Plasmodium sp. DRC-Itaito]|nr:splicing factor 3B subunit 3,putative [Plasmodium sp. DRC-Itaito]